jgi:hypothetical protein
LYPCTITYSPLVRARRPVPARPREACGQVRACERGGWRAARADAGKAAGDGKVKGQTVINSVAVSDANRGIGEELAISRPRGVDCLGKGEMASWRTRKLRV